MPYDRQRADLDGQAAAALVGGRGGRDARVAVAGRRAVGDQAVVGGVRGEPVPPLARPVTLVEDEPVGLGDAHAVLVEAADGDATQVEAVGTVGADADLLVALDDHRAADALDLQVVDAGDADEALQVRAGALVVVGERRCSPSSFAHRPLGARERGLLVVGAGQHVDRRAARA